MSDTKEKWYTMAEAMKEKDDINSANIAYTKIGGICYNRKKQREHDAEQNY